MKNVKKQLLQSAALIGGSVLSLAMAQQALAASASNVQVTNVTAINSLQCRVDYQFTIQGTVVDAGAAVDFYAFQPTDMAGNVYPSYSSSNPIGRSLVIVGGSVNQTVQKSISVSVPSHTEPYVSIFDTTSATDNLIPGNLIGQAVIPDAMLKAQGSGCLRIRENNEPTVDAGVDSNLTPGASQTFTGSATDMDNDALAISYTQISGPAVTISNPNNLNASFVAPASTAATQTLVFRLSANDSFITETDTVTYTIPGNAAPVANAGADQNVSGGATVNLAGTASDADNDPLTYAWTQTAGAAVTLNGATTLTPTFTAPPKSNIAQTLTFELVANDGTVDSNADSVDIVVAANQAPNAVVSGPANVAGGSNVTLDGSASNDPDGDPLIYQWSQVSGPLVTLSSTGVAMPTFTAPAAMSSVQPIVFELLVADPLDATDTARVTVQIAANAAPIPDAGPDQNVTGGSAVTLDGSGSSDPENDTLIYNWVQTAGPTVTLNNANAVNPTFTAPQALTNAQTITFLLTVDDGVQRNAMPAADMVDIVIAANRPPLADAGADQGPIDSGQAVTLDGTASSDPDGDNLTYSWRQVSGTQVSLTGGNSVTPTFVAPLVNGNEDLVFELIVNDGTIDSPPNTVTIAIRAIGSITIIQRVVGSDTTIAFTSNVAALSGPITTVGGNGQLVAATVPAGSYTISAADLSANGYAVTDISCNDTDSVTNLASRSVALALSPNEDLVCTFTSANSREAASSAIRDFLTGRNALIMSHQPDLQRRLDRLQEQPGTGGSATAFGLPIPGSGRLPLNASFARGRSRIATSLAMASAALGDPDRGKQPFDIWAEAFFANAALGTQRGSFRIAHLGADYRVNSNILLGVLGEFDDFSNDGPLAVGEAEGNGWLVGPYAMVRLDKNLFAEVRAAWGKSNNSVSPLGTFVDDFKTSRSFYSGSFIGQFDIGKNTEIRPELTIRHLSDKQKAYVDALNIAIPGQTVDQGDISFRPRIQHTVKLDSGWSLRPFGEVEGIYTFGTDVNNILDNGVRARIEAGLDIFSGGGFRASLSGFHDGILSDNYRSSGAHITLSFGF